MSEIIENYIIFIDVNNNNNNDVLEISDEISDLENNRIFWQRISIHVLTKIVLDCGKNVLIVDGLAI